MRRILWVVCGLLLAVAVLGGAYVGFNRWFYVIERTDVSSQPPRVELPLTDDRLEDKHPVFDEALVDSRPLGDWQINSSDAVIELRCLDLRPDYEAELLALRPSYRAAQQAAKYGFLPSANLVDGAAKQFDDGLYAAIDLACYQGRVGPGPSAPEMIRSIFDQLPPESPARAFLAAALTLAGEQVELNAAESAAKQKLLADFEQNQVRSKPIGFYTWSADLEQVWRFCRFLQFEFDDQHLAVPTSIAATLEKDPATLERYRTFNRFYGQLTNPRICLAVDDLIGETASLSELARRRSAHRPAVAVFPPSTSRETELFDRLFSEGLPPNANLMGELIRAILTSKVDLAPGPNDGWYQYQVYALETMLLPGKGQEADKLLLMATYKKRLVEAFQSIITKRRETHVKELASTAKSSEAVIVRPLDQVSPRLRVEPCATFYLRTARAYAFLNDFLLAAAGEEALHGLHGLHGLREGGAREPNLFDELGTMRRRFYGLYLIACEDIGLKPAFMDNEPVQPDQAKQEALAWLNNLDKDPDLACDTRVAVPLYVDDRATRLWGALGVRLVRLEASYARAPRARPAQTGGEWQTVEPAKLSKSTYLIPADEFGEFELPGSRVLTRKEFRAVCDAHKTKDDILKALARQ